MKQGEGVFPISSQFLETIDTFWTEIHGTNDWLLGDVYRGLCEKFINKVIIKDAARFNQIKGKSVIYLANHQTAVESILFIYLMGGLTKTLISAVAKEEHKSTWFGKLHQHSKHHPAGTPHETLIFFDRGNPASFLGILRDMEHLLIERNTSIFIHTEGTRALSCREATTKVNRRTLQLAIQAKTPIVPVRFSGGLPMEKASHRLDYPTGFGTQDIYVGNPIHPEDLERLDFSSQKELLLSAINNIGIPVAEELPSLPDERFEQELIENMKRTNTSLDLALLITALKKLSRPSRDYISLLRLIETREASVENSATMAWLTEVLDIFNESVHAT